MPSKEEVVEALREVEDPELGMDIVELGLFYDAEIEGPNVKVHYTLTSMGCPAGAMIQEDIERVVRQIPGVEDVASELTFDPPWTPDRMSDDAKFILGFGSTAPEGRFSPLPISYRAAAALPTRLSDSPTVNSDRLSKEQRTLIKQRILISLSVAAVALIAATAALAGTLTTTATIGGTAGISLNLPANPSIPDPLDGSDQTASYAPVLGLVDARGSGAGWNITVSATNFSDGSGHTLAPRTVTRASSACS